MKRIQWGGFLLSVVLFGICGFCLGQDVAVCSADRARRPCSWRPCSSSMPCGTVCREQPSAPCPSPCSRLALGTLHPVPLRTALQPSQRLSWACCSSSVSVCVFIVQGSEPLSQEPENQAVGTPCLQSKGRCVRA